MANFMTSISEWVDEIKKYVPDGRTVAATFRKDPEGFYEVCFRARTTRKSLIAVTRSHELQSAAHQAGTILKRQIMREHSQRPAEPQPSPPLQIAS